MDTNLKIAVVTCARNESQHVARWADTTREADFRFWLLNNEGDDDWPTAKAIFTNNENGGPRIQYACANIDPFRFDFARNMAMAMLPSWIDVAIQLDCDEIFDTGWRKGFDDNPDHDRWSYWMENRAQGGWSWVKRSNAVRMGKGFHWRHPVHEVIEGPQPTCHLDGTVIAHIPDPAKSRADYLPWLEEAVKAEPHNARMRFYLGREYYFRGNYERGREELLHYSDMGNSWPTEVGEAYRLIARMAYQPEVWLWKAIGEDPLRREPYVDLAIKARDADDLPTARALLTIAEKRTDKGRYTSEDHAWDEPFEILKSECGVSDQPVSGPEPIL